MRLELLFVAHALARVAVAAVLLVSGRVRPVRGGRHLALAALPAAPGAGVWYTALRTPLVVP